MTRRELDLPDLQSIVLEAQRLHDEGYERQGKWGLAEVAWHVSQTMKSSFTPPEMPPEMAPETAPAPGSGAEPAGSAGRLATLLGPRLSRQLFSTRRIRPGLRATDASTPPEGLDDAQELEQLRQTVQRFQNHVGPFQPHPTLGQLTREQWLNLHVIHAAHHLSFLRPTAQLAARPLP